MNEEDILTQWKQYRRSVEAPEDFEVRMMEAVRRHPAPVPARHYLLCRYPVLTGRVAGWAAAIGAVLLGLLRISYITSALLVP